ncbi:hypothetical protein BaRGS_00021165, partial [Batillaria attramentaria]
LLNGRGANNEGNPSQYFPARILIEADEAVFLPEVKRHVMTPELNSISSVSLNPEEKQIVFFPK